MLFLKYCRSLMLAGMVAVATPTVAQEFSSLEKRLREHPSLQELSFEALANREQATAITALPDPELSLAVNNVPLANPSFDRFLPSNKAIGILQMFPNRAGRDARSTRMLETADQIDALTLARFSELRGQLLVDLIEMQRIGQQRELAKARDAKYSELIQVVEGEIKAGKPALFRLAEIERERAEVARTLVELDSELARVNVSVNAKVGPVENAVLPPVSPVKWNQDPRHFHAVRVAHYDTSIAEESVKEARSAWKPSWGVHLTYQQRESGRGGSDAGFGGDDWFSAGVKFSVPVWGKQKQAPDVRAAEALRSSAQARVRAMVLHSVASYENLRTVHEAATRSKEILLEKIAAIRMEISAQQSHYESGAGDYAPVIDGELALLTLKAEIAAENARALSSIVLSNALLVTP